MLHIICYVLLGLFLKAIRTTNKKKVPQTIRNYFLWVIYLNVSISRQEVGGKYGNSKTNRKWVKQKRDNQIGKQNEKLMRNKNEKQDSKNELLNSNLEALYKRLVKVIALDSISRLILSSHLTFLMGSSYHVTSLLSSLLVSSSPHSSIIPNYLYWLKIPQDATGRSYDTVSLTRKKLTVSKKGKPFLPNWDSYTKTTVFSTFQIWLLDGQYVKLLTWPKLWGNRVFSTGCRNRELLYPLAVLPQKKDVTENHPSNKVKIHSNLQHYASLNIAKRKDGKLKLCIKIIYNDSVCVLNIKGPGSFLIHRISFI